jgi:hypothetical protein
MGPSEEPRTNCAFVGDQIKNFKRLAMQSEKREALVAHRVSFRDIDGQFDILFVEFLR